MGLSFHYRGKLKNAQMLPSFVEEIEDICQILNWKTSVFDTEYPDHKFTSPPNNEDYGIIFTPPECEPVCFVFDSEGNIYVPWLKDILNKNESGEVKVITVQLNLTDDGLEPVVSEKSEGFDPKLLVYQVHVKTQFAGAETHIKVIELLKYLSGKYLDDFELIDESKYYETGNIELLQDKLNVINEFLDSFQEMLNEATIKSPKDFIRLLKKITRKHKNNDDNPEE
ncbi:MAG: hypothetical protein IPK35_01000 [Saprospiraceae bacterium]|jgi:hypothetical protein|nr:hypothetical protein [Saprospiraceae bacterium]